jgi:hypothetical protein
MMTATPVMYPTSTGLDSSSARNPNRASRASRHTPPTTTASRAASAAYRPGSPAASGAMADAVMSAVVDSGPTESCRDEPRTVYTSSDPQIAHSPATAGRPAISAYAMTCGTRYAATVIPATTSPRSQPRS